MLKRLRHRFILINMILVSLVLAITFGTLIISAASKMENESYSSLEREFANVFYPSINSLPHKDMPFDNESPFSTFFVTIDKDENITNIDDISNTLTLDVANTAVATALMEDEIQGSIKSLSLRYRVFTQNKGVTIIGFIDTSFEDDFINQQIMNYLLIGIGSLAAFFFISLLLSGLAIKPIEKAWYQQQQFVADASHELKTPITVLLANTSILLSNKNDDEKQRHKWLSYIDIEAKRMKKLVEDLLYLARFDSKESNVLMIKLSLSNTVLECVLPFDAVMFESGKTLEHQIEEGIDIKGDVGQIKQLIIILLDNANKYALDNSMIKVKLYRENNKAILTVNNLSTPLDKNEVDHIFDRFYRVDKARVRNKSSYGLGLSIAKEIVTQYKGDIKVSSDVDKGTTFTVILPIN